MEISGYHGPSLPNPCCWNVPSICARQLQLATESGLDERAEQCGHKKTQNATRSRAIARLLHLCAGERLLRRLWRPCLCCSSPLRHRKDGNLKSKGQKREKVKKVFETLSLSQRVRVLKKGPHVESEEKRKEKTTSSDKLPHDIAPD